MDELQDAIEDAQYVNAIACVDEGPRPMLAWDFPNDEQLENWKKTKNASLLAEYKRRTERLSSKVQKSGDSDTATATAVSMVASDTGRFSTTPESSAVKEDERSNDVSPGETKDRIENLLESCEFVCSQALGFFLFSQYLKTNRKDYLRINFVEDVILYRRIRGAQNREEKARQIATTYLTCPAPASVSASICRMSGTEGPDGGGEGHGPTQGSAKVESSGHQSGSTKPKHRVGASQFSTASDDVFTKETELVIQSVPKNVPEIPSCKEIVELDLFREPQLRRRTPEDRKADEDEFSAIIDENLDPSCKKCLVGVDGPALTKCVKRALGGIPHTLQQSTVIPAGATAKSEDQDENVNGDAKEVEHERDEKKEESKIAEDERKTSAEEAEEDEEPDDSGEVGARDVFDVVEMIVMEGLRRQYWNSFLMSEVYRKLLNFWWFRDRKVVEEDFFLMRVLGRGGFGLVHACKKGTSGKLYAMKVMNKKRIKIKKSEQLTLNERKALAAVDSPFIVKLAYAFQSKDDIFLILDLMTGGDLGFHLHQKGRFSKKECLYFSARIMLGLQALHDRRYVYRDLKPENVLVADDGRVKLSDLGLATKVTPTLHGAAGTRGYWAPEMLRRDSRGKRMPYGTSVDWFSFGCVLAEFISGVNPFRSEVALKFGLQEGMTTKEKAIDCATMKMEPKFDPAKFDHDSADLCRQLLDKDEKKRLGVRGCEEIMGHPWYRDLNWEAIVSDRMKPPFEPAKDVNAHSQSEIGTFAEDATYKETIMEQKDEEIYREWDWTNPKACDAEIIEFLIHERRLGEPLLPAEPMNPCCCSML